jgi:hypothetical protein
MIAGRRKQKHGREKIGVGGRRIEGEEKQKGLIERGKQNKRSEKKKELRE